MAWKCIAEGKELADVRADRKESKSIEKYKVSQSAVYFEGQYLPFAAEKAFLWLASPDDIPQICGYHILSRLFMNKQEPNERGINEFIDQALVALQSPSVPVRKAAMQALIRFSELGLMYQRLAHSAISSIGLDFI